MFVCRIAELEMRLFEVLSFRSPSGRLKANGSSLKWQNQYEGMA
jgi:hypothetical protein